MKVKDILEGKGTKVATIGTEETVSQVVSKLVEMNIGSLLVMDEKGEIAGIITERDVLRQCDKCIDSFKDLYFDALPSFPQLSSFDPHGYTY